jgi:hypothetical protein
MYYGRTVAENGQGSNLGSRNGNQAIDTGGGGQDYSNSQDRILKNNVKKRMETSSSPSGGNHEIGVFDKNKANVHLMRNTVGAAGYGFY